jgi:hypothetical protein
VVDHIPAHQSQLLQLWGTLMSLATPGSDRHRVKAQLNFTAVLVLLSMLITACQEVKQGPANFYNPNTETTLNGTVEQVETAIVPGGGLSQQAEGKYSGPIYLNLKAESGMLRVLLGPSWFLESKGFKFAQGDQIEVTGSKFQDEDMIVAREVKKGDQVLVLRNADGTPEWSRGQ